jgi:DNA-binding CsgD family transcriptional regulator
MDNDRVEADFDYQWTPRQREVLALMAKGRTNGEIAELLGISLAGAKWHVSEVLTKLGVASREEAAEYWKRAHRPSARMRRAFRALTGLTFVAKAAAGATGMLAVAAGGVIFVGALASDGAVGSAAEPAPTPDLSCARQPGPADTIITLDGAVPQPILFAMRGTPGICMGTTWPGSVNIAIVGLRANTDLLAHVNLAERNTCPATLYGFADQETAAVRLIYDDGSVLPLTLVAGPAALQTEGRFFYSVIDCEKMVDHVEALDGAGNIIASQDLWDARQGYSTKPSHPPLAADFVTSGEGDPGGGGFSSSGFFAVPTEGATIEFNVQHEGTIPFEVTPWCGTGIVPVEWVEGPSGPGGSGVIRLQIPAGNVACAFANIRSNSTWRISGR